MAKTSDQLILRALTIVGVTAQGQAPTADDIQIVRDQLTPMLEQLAMMETVYIPDQDAIDEAIFLPLATRLALQIGPDFGLPAMTPDQRKAADHEIRIVQSSRRVFQPLKVDYF